MNRRNSVLTALVVIGIQFGSTQIADAGNRVSLDFFKNAPYTDINGVRIWNSGTLLNSNGQPIPGTSIQVLIRLDTIVRNGSSGVAHINDFTMNVNLGGGQMFSLGMWGAVDPHGRIAFNGRVTAATDASHIGSPAQLRAANLPTGEVSGTIYVTFP